MSKYRGKQTSNPSAPSWPQPSGYGGSGAAGHGTAPHGQPPTSSAHGISPYGQPPTSSVPHSQSFTSWQNQSNASAPAAGASPYSKYPSYGGYPPQQQYGSSYMQSPFPPGTDPEVVRVFQAADRDGNGLVDEYELQRTLSTSQPFCLRTCRLMIHLFGRSDSKKIGPKDFTSLWKSLKDWKSVFERFDRDRSGSIDEDEMRDALMSLGYAISTPILDCLLQKYDRTGQGKAMDYDSFVECGLIVKGLTEKFKEQDTHLRGSATLDYQTFMLMVLPFVVA